MGRTTTWTSTSDEDEEAVDKEEEAEAVWLDLIIEQEGRHVVVTGRASWIARLAIDIADRDDRRAATSKHIKLIPVFGGSQGRKCVIRLW